MGEEHLDFLATPLSGWIELGRCAFACEVSEVVSQPVV